MQEVQGWIDNLYCWIDVCVNGGYYLLFYGVQLYYCFDVICQEVNDMLVQYNGGLFGDEQCVLNQEFDMVVCVIGE